MKEKNTFTLEHLPKDQSNLDLLRHLSDDEINERALTDLDAHPPTVDELKQFKAVHPNQEVDVKQIRKQLHMTQTVFAALFGINKRTIQEWEQGRRQPEGPARVLLTVIANEPEAVQRALLKAQHNN